MSNPLSKAAHRTISEKPKSEVCQWGGERRGRKEPVVTMPYFGQIQESQNTDGPVPRLGEPQLSRFRARSLRLASLQPTGRIVPVCLRLRSAAPAALCGSGCWRHAASGSLAAREPAVQHVHRCAGRRWERELLVWVKNERKRH